MECGGHGEGEEETGCVRNRETVGSTVGKGLGACKQSGVSD